jgi:hypothetical protein
MGRPRNLFEHENPATEVAWITEALEMINLEKNFFGGSE